MKNSLCVVLCFDSLPQLSALLFCCCCCCFLFSSVSLSVSVLWGAEFSVPNWKEALCKDDGYLPFSIPGDLNQFLFAIQNLRTRSGVHEKRSYTEIQRSISTPCRDSFIFALKNLGNSFRGMVGVSFDSQVKCFALFPLMSRKI